MARTELSKSMCRKSRVNELSQTFGENVYSSLNAQLIFERMMGLNVVYKNADPQSNESKFRRMK